MKLLTVLPLLLVFSFLYCNIPLSPVAATIEVDWATQSGHYGVDGWHWAEGHPNNDTWTETSAIHHIVGVADSYIEVEAEAETSGTHLQTTDSNIADLDLDVYNKTRLRVWCNVSKTEVWIHFWEGESSSSINCGSITADTWTVYDDDVPAGAKEYTLTKIDLQVDGAPGNFHTVKWDYLKIYKEVDAATGYITTRVSDVFLGSAVEILLSNLESANYSIEANGHELTSWENPANWTAKTVFLSFDDKHVVDDMIKVDLVDADADYTLDSVYLSINDPEKFFSIQMLLDLFVSLLPFIIVITFACVVIYALLIYWPKIREV